MNKLHRNKHHRGSRSSTKGDSLNRDAFKLFMFGKFEEAAESCKKIIASHP